MAGRVNRGWGALIGVQVFGAITALTVSGVAMAQWSDVTPIDAVVGNTQGSAWGDYDGDGDLDLYITRRNETNILLRNDSGAFTNVSADPINLSVGSRLSGRAIWGDYDNDGDLDLYVSQITDSHLFRNSGAGTFTDVTNGNPLGMQNRLPRAAAWGDYNNDGFIDLYVASFSGNSNASRLIRNNGDGTFSDVTFQIGVVADGGIGRSASWADYDDNGFPDIYVANGGEPTSSATEAEAPNGLYQNFGSKVFVDAGAGPASSPNHSRGHAWGDYDNDGDLDLYIAAVEIQFGACCLNNGTCVEDTQVRCENSLGGAFAGDGTMCDAGDPCGDGFVAALGEAANGANQLLRNDGGTFTDITPTNLAITEDSNGCSWVDYDNDGDLDLFVTNETAHCQLFENDGTGGFTDITSAVIEGRPNANNSASWGDYDGDGDMDVFIASKTGADSILARNALDNTNRWIMFDLVGATSNRDAIGARITIDIGGDIQIREVNSGSGYFAQHQINAHFGLGAAATIDTVTVDWPSGEQTVIMNVAADQVLTVGEGCVSCVNCALDCNGNGFEDACDIISGVEEDCNGNSIPDSCETPGNAQWAVEVLDQSSEFNETDDYAAEQVLGVPNVFVYGDSRNAWSPTSQDGTEEFILLRYRTPVFADGVTVRETWGVGSVIRIELIDENEDVMIVFEGTDPSVDGEIADFRVDFERTKTLVDRVRVTTNTDATAVWEEIDAVALHGVIGDGITDCNDNGIADACDIDMGVADCNENGIIDRCEFENSNLFADAATAFSSQFSATDYSAAMATGAPDVDVYGDSPNAWSADTQDGTREFLVFTFDATAPLHATGLSVTESWGAGSVFQMDVLDADGSWHTMWVGDDPSPEGEIATFTRRWPATDYEVVAARIHIDTSATSDWEEIDAVKLLATTDPAVDCDGNGVDDSCDLLDDDADCNDNGILDLCELGRATLWASSVIDVSSQFNTTGDYAAVQSLGGPDTFAYGDSPLAWSPTSQNGTTEFVSVGFDVPIFADGVTVRETWGSSSVRRIDLIDIADNVITVFDGLDPSPIGAIADFRVDFNLTDVLIKGVTVTTDTDATSEWEEIDAIALHGLYDGATDLDDNGTPDDCEVFCPTDCSPPGGNGVVNIDDLLAVVDAFSTQDLACDVAPDNGDGTAGNGVINIDDLLAVIDSFGPCE